MKFRRSEKTFSKREREEEKTIIIRVIEIKEGFWCLVVSSTHAWC